MREPHAPGPMPPRDWSEVFAALPPETPPADALSGVFAQLPASTPTRSGRQWWIAAAAVLALAAMVPLALMVPFARHSREGGNPRTLAQTPGEIHPPSLLTSQTREKSASTKPEKSMDSRLRGNDEQEHSTPVRVAKADPPRRKPHRTHKPAAAEPSDHAMEPLYAESARLEALLALARDDRAASATAVALGSDFEARVASIDAVLAQPSLTAQRRLELWKDRVSALRAYASFESTQRALAASGERYDAMLVSID